MTAASDPHPPARLRSPSPSDDALRHDRLARLRGSLVSADLDWLVVGQPEHVAYATGYRSVGADVFRTHGMAALVSADDLWLVGPCGDSAPALETGAVPGDRYVAYGRFFFESPDGQAVPTRLVDEHADLTAAAGAALDRAAVAGRVGVDGVAARALAGAFAQRSIQPIDVTDDVRALRAVKLPGEIAKLRRAASLAESGISRALDQATAGVTERELAAVVARVMAEGGGVPRFVVVTSGERSALADTRPTARAWKPGELLRFDVGCVVDGYWSDLGRTAVLGEPDRLQAERYAAILEGESAQLEQVRAGMTAGDLFSVAVAAVERRGLRPYRRHHCGHGIGTEIYEPPTVAPGVSTVLEDGMVLCVETPFYELGWGGMMVEDTIVVRSGGCERLSHADRGLRVVNA